MSPIRDGVSAVLQQYPDVYDVTAAYKCDNCGFLNLFHVLMPGSRTPMDIWDYLDQATAEHSRWIPIKGHGKTFEDVPEHIADAASEAFTCLSVDAARAAVSVARAVIEATAKEKGITSGSLMTKINAMKDQGFLRPHITEAAHEIRHVGNDMAHGDFVDPIDPAEASSVLALMSEVLAEVFQSPARVAKIREARLAREAALRALAGE
jgi:hypothetical protein